MSDDKYPCPWEGCGREFYTQVGLDVHMKTHFAEEKKEKEPAAKPVAKETPKPKATKRGVRDKTISELTSKYLTEKQAKELWKQRTKSMRKETTVKVSDKLTKKKFCKMLEVHNWLEQKSERKFTARSYVIKEARKMLNGWYSFFAVGDNGQKVSWREGPIKGRHHITIAKLE